MQANSELQDKKRDSGFHHVECFAGISSLILAIALHINAIYPHFTDKEIETQESVSSLSRAMLLASGSAGISALYDSKPHPPLPWEASMRQRH